MANGDGEGDKASATIDEIEAVAVRLTPGRQQLRLTPLGIDIARGLAAAEARAKSERATLARRAEYGGRKGRRAARRLRALETSR
jgi:hypothetical protein